MLERGTIGKPRFRTRSAAGTTWALMAQGISDACIFVRGRQERIAQPTMERGHGSPLYAAFEPVPTDGARVETTQPAVDDNKIVSFSQLSYEPIEPRKVIGIIGVTQRNLKLRGHGMEFASEMVVRCRLARMRIAKVPTTLKKDRRSRRPHLPQHDHETPFRCFDAASKGRSIAAF